MEYSQEVCFNLHNDSWRKYWYGDRAKWDGGGGGTRDLPLESMQRLRSFAEGWLRPGIVIYRKI